MADVKKRTKKETAPDIEVSQLVEEEVEEETIPLKVNGNQIREEIKNLKDRRSLLYRELDRAKATFDDEEEREPLLILNDIDETNLKVALLQSFQTSYNQTVKVKVPQHPHPLTMTFFIKAIDGTSKQLRTLKEMLNLGEGKDSLFGARYSTRAHIRREGEEVSTSRVSDEELFARRIIISRKDANYRAAIATGNTQQIDVPEVVRFLFE